MADCTCAECVSACERRPGWFHPDQIPAVAAHLGLSVEEAMATRLAIDWWAPDAHAPYTEIVAPRIVGGGARYGFWPEGQCTFLTPDGKCEIHPVKPLECRQAMPCDPSYDSAPLRPLLRLRPPATADSHGVGQEITYSRGLVPL